MIRTVIVFGIAVTVLLSACCPTTSLHPLSPPEKAQYDGQLGGTWVPVEEDDEKGYLHVGKVKDGMTGVLVVAIKNNGELEHNAFTVFPTIMPKGKFLNVKAEEVLDDLPPENAGYLFMRYELHGSDSLSIYYMDEDLFSKAIQEGRLKGEITYEKISLRNNNGEKDRKDGKGRDIECVRITDASENILRFIMDNDAKLLFPDEVKLKRLRVAKTEAN